MQVWTMCWCIVVVVVVVVDDDVIAVILSLTTVIFLFDALLYSIIWCLAGILDIFTEATTQQYDISLKK